MLIDPEHPRCPPAIRFLRAKHMDTEYLYPEDADFILIAMKHLQQHAEFMLKSPRPLRAET